MHNLLKGYGIRDSVAEGMPYDARERTIIGGSREERDKDLYAAEDKAG